LSDRRLPPELPRHSPGQIPQARQDATDATLTQKGTYQLPDEASLEERQAIEVTRSQLSLILDGIDLSSARQRMRFRPLRELSKHDAPLAC